jgi:hypothetical protein
VCLIFVGLARPLLQLVTFVMTVLVTVLVSRLGTSCSLCYIQLAADVVCSSISSRVLFDNHHHVQQLELPRSPNC